MAPVPSFVGYSPWATSVLPTGSIATVTSSCLPSGTAIGDDVFVFIRFSQFIGGGSGPSPGQYLAAVIADNGGSISLPSDFDYRPDRTVIFGTLAGDTDETFRVYTAQINVPADGPADDD